MFDPTQSRWLFRLLGVWERLKLKLKGRPPGERQAEQQLTAFYVDAWRQAAAQLGATVADLGENFLEIRLGERRTRVQHNNSAIDDLATHLLIRTKGVMYRLLGAHGVTIPRHLEFSAADLRSAVAFLEVSDRPCVVKPANGTAGGLAVTTGVRTRWQLARAAWAASLYGNHPIIEEQVDGDNYRLLYLDGELLDVVKREPPSVAADGESTVLQLLRRVNRERLEQPLAAHVQITQDLDVQTTLRRQGFTLQSVPARGTVVQLKTVINENSARENVSARHELCDEILREAALAVQVSGLRLAGVDLIVRDARRALRDGGGVVLEVNSPPGYFWHYHKRDGSCPVALHVLRALFEVPDVQGPYGNGDAAHWTGRAAAS